MDGFDVVEEYARSVGGVHLAEARLRHFAPSDRPVSRQGSGPWLALSGANPGSEFSGYLGTLWRIPNMRKLLETDWTRVIKEGA